GKRGTDQNQTSVNSDTDGNCGQLRARKLALEFMKAVMELEGGTNRTLCIVFGGSRITKIAQHSVAAKMGNEAAVALHYRQGEPLILQLQIPQILGIQPFRQLGIAHKLAKKDRQLATLRDS